MTYPYISDLIDLIHKEIKLNDEPHWHYYLKILKGYPTNSEIIKIKKRLKAESIKRHYLRKKKLLEESNHQS